MHRVKGFDFLMGYAVACSSSHARVQDFLSRKLQVCKVLEGGSSIFQGVYLLISMETYITCDFQGDGGPDPLPSFGSANASFTYLRIFHSVLSYIKFARDQSHDILRLELGKVKNTTFLVKRKFLFLRTI